MNGQPRLPPMEKGFTLTELAVVMVITALLVGGLLVPLAAQIEIRDINDNRKTMAEIREALLGFAMVNRYLPCPALPTIASGSADAGREGTRNGGGTCVHPAGVLPWATLGVPETDAWGRRYSYRVTPAFSNSTPPFFLLSSVGDLVIRPSAASTATVAESIPAVVISHGKNGNGAYTPAGTALPAATDPDERANEIVPSGGTGWTDNGTAKEFVKRSARTAGYDDEVVWISPGVLFNRMVSAGKLP